MAKGKLSILVADDSEMNRSILADMLGDGVDILVAEDGVRAVEVLRERHGELSLVLLDIVMPNLDGFGVLETMGREHWIEDVPVVMISAESMPSHVARAYGMGVVDFVSRPFDALVVRRRVLNAVMLYARRGELGVPAGRFYGDARWGEPPASDRSIRLLELERRASTDPLTGLLNHAAAKRRIRARMEERPGDGFALAILDLDLFKQANDTYGHLFGDELLRHLADRLRACVRGGDVVARVGGDEFLVFLQYAGGQLEPAVSRIHSSLCGKFRDFDVSLSMGVARTGELGTDYDALFHAADQALYSIKKGRRGKGGAYRFYDETMARPDSAISPIDGGGRDG